MNDDFTAVHVSVANEYTDILIAELAEVGYDGFLETENGFEAYINHNRFDTNHVNEIISRYSGLTTVHYTTSQIQKTNWNKEWEKNYQPILIGSQCMVRATFHKPVPGIQYDIIINPKMSFGTDHHATTSLMLECLLGINCTNKKIFDVGCGTGILAILAAFKGASEILATDIDDWAVENTTENCELNKVIATIKKGTIAQVQPQNQFDIILANINRNVLLNEMQQYSRLLEADRGNLLLSGFYEADIPAISNKANACGLQIMNQQTKKNWACLQLIRTK